MIASWSGVVSPASIKACAAAWKSSNTFCLCSRRPARCHASPSSPPPRSDATTYVPPAATQVSAVEENPGLSELANPP